MRCQLEHVIYRAVFGEEFPIFLCIWHLKRNWLENLGAKVREGCRYSSC
jgi:hypothetical protein